MKSLQVKKDEETGELYIDLADLAEVYDIDQMHSFSFEVENGAVVLEVFDVEGNLLRPKTTDETTEA